MIIVQACEFVSTGDGRYRLHEPMQALGQRKDTIAIDCHVGHRLFPSLARLADVLVVPFLNSWDLFPLIEERKKLGRPTILESNDFFLDLQPWNPIFNDWLSPDLVTLHDALAANCDGVQTSTPFLAEFLSRFSSKVAVFENHLVRVPDLKPMRKGLLTVGWAGSQGHLADFLSMYRAIRPWLLRHPEVQLAVMTNERGRELIDLPPERVVFRSAGTLSDYLEFIQRLDIGIAPLLATNYNRGRSDVKFLEYAAYGVAGIYSDLGPYNRSVKNGENGILYKNDSELIAALDSLLGNENLRESIRLKAHRYVSSNRSLSERVEERSSFYRSLMSHKAQDKSPLRETFQKHRVALGQKEIESGQGYLAIDLDESSREVVALGKDKPAPDVVARLHAVVRSLPEFTAASLALARALNTLKSPSDAKMICEEGLRHTPNDVGLLCELGRALHLLKRSSEGADFLEKAVGINPRSLVTWSYFLGVLSKVKNVPLERHINACLTYHPRSITLSTLLLPLVAAPERPKLLLDLFARLGELPPHAWQVAARTLVPAITQILATPTPIEGRQQLASAGLVYFPHSPRLLEACAKLALERGAPAERDAYLARALDIRSAALSYWSEYPKDDSDVLSWEIANHLHRIP